MRAYGPALPPRLPPKYNLGNLTVSTVLQNQNVLSNTWTLENINGLNDIAYLIVFNEARVPGERRYII